MIFSKKKRARVEWVEAKDIGGRVRDLVRFGGFDGVKNIRVFCFRSFNSKTRAYARIWGLSRIWQQALGIQAAYIIEVISEKFDRLSEKEQDMVLIHELLHIPKNFSGALLAHRAKGGVNDRVVREIYSRYMKDRGRLIRLADD